MIRHLRRSVVVAVVATGIPLTTPIPAVAECTLKTETYLSNGVVKTRTVLVCTPDVTDAGTGSDAPTSPTACELKAEQLGYDPSDFCQEAAQPGGPTEVTPGVASAIWRRIDLPPSELVVQPPDGKTLVNFETNFYTEPARIERTLRMLGQRVEFRIWASAYTWRFGDGEQVSTSEPGAPYPNLDVTHDYRLPGRYRPSVDTTYAAEFRVSGRTWQPVPGSATIPGTAVPLRAVEARPLLVS